MVAIRVSIQVASISYLGVSYAGALSLLSFHFLALGYVSIKYLDFLSPLERKMKVTESEKDCVDVVVWLSLVEHKSAPGFD